MVLLELATQGVKGCSPTTRAALSQGYVVLKPPGAEAVLLSGLASALLYSDGRGDDRAFLAPQVASGKAGLTLQGNDLNTYRVLRELGGGGTLHRLNKDTQKYELVTQDTLEIGQYLRGQVGVPAKSVFEQLFVFAAGSFPSRKPKPKDSAIAAKKQPSLQAAMSVTAADDIDAAEAKLAALERELGMAGEIDRLQFQQDGLASQMFALESQLKGTEGLKHALAQAKAQYDAAPTVEALDLPKDIVSRCERYPTLQQKRDEALAKLHAEKGGGDESMSSSRTYTPDPFFKDPRFLGGVAAGVVFLALGLFLRAGAGRYLALFDIPAFGFAALIALKWVDELQGSQKVGRKEGMLAAREKKITEEFAQEARQVTSAMSRLNVESPQDVVDTLSRKPLLAEKVREYEAQLAEAEANPDFAQAAHRYAELKAQSEQITAELQSRSGNYVRDPREVEREMARVRESIELARSGGPAPVAAVEAVPNAPGEQFEDPTPALLAMAAELFQLDAPSVASLVRDRCVQYVGALSDRRYSALEIDHRGAAVLVSAERRVPAGELPAKDLDLYYMALRLTLVEKLCAKLKLPVLLDDVLGAVVDEPKQALVARMLKHLGTLTQVVHVTRSLALHAMADGTVSL